MPPAEPDPGLPDEPDQLDRTRGPVSDEARDGPGLSPRLRRVVGVLGALVLLLALVALAAPLLAGPVVGLVVRAVDVEPEAADVSLDFRGVVGGLRSQALLWRDGSCLGVLSCSDRCLIWFS